MVKKRAKLSGQAQEIFLSKGESKLKTNMKRDRDTSSSNKQQDLFVKINALKDLILQFKECVNEDEFNILRVKNLDEFNS